MEDHQLFWRFTTKSRLHLSIFRTHINSFCIKGWSMERSKISPKRALEELENPKFALSCALPLSNIFISSLTYNTYWNHDVECHWWRTKLTLRWQWFWGICFEIFVVFLRLNWRPCLIVGRHKPRWVYYINAIWFIADAMSLQRGANIDSILGHLSEHPYRAPLAAPPFFATFSIGDR